MPNIFSPRKTVEVQSPVSTQWQYNQKQCNDYSPWNTAVMRTPDSADLMSRGPMTPTAGSPNCSTTYLGATEAGSPIAVIGKRQCFFKPAAGEETTQQIRAALTC